MKGGAFAPPFFWPKCALKKFMASEFPLRKGGVRGAAINGRNSSSKPTTVTIEINLQIVSSFECGKREDL